MQADASKILSRARECLQLEANAILTTSERLNDSFIQVLDVVRESIEAGGKLILTGVGKNTPIAQKLVSTFNSTGVPACFLDPNQALHGDLGLCRDIDLCFLFSNSGETEDLLRLIPLLRRLGLKTVAVTRHGPSTLAENCDYTLAYHAEREACPHNLAPTASTTAALALGDALAMVCMELRGFGREDFARYHPAGSLGKALLLTVRDIMRKGDRFACLPASTTVRDALIAMTHSKCGTIALTTEDGKLAGVFSDGDFRRASLKDEFILQRPVADIMTRNPKTVNAAALAVEALKLFERSSVNDLVALDEELKPVGLVDGQDLPKLRII